MIIKHKLIGNTALVALGLAALFALLVKEVLVIQNLGNKIAQAEHLNTEMLELRKIEKDFLARKDPEQQAHFTETFSQLNNQISELKLFYLEEELSPQHLNNLTQQLEQYREQFNLLVDVQTQLGLSYQQGLAGSIRDIAREFEALLVDRTSTPLYSGYLNLRRVEKDFLLRKQEKYVKTFSQYSRLLKMQLPVKDGKALDKYMKEFAKLVELERRKGLTHQQGILGDLRKAVNTAEGSLTKLEQEIRQAIDNKVDRVITTGFVIFALITLMVITANIIISKSVLTPITRLTQTISRIRQENDLTKRVDVIGKDELSQLSTDFNGLLDNFQHIIKEVNQAISSLSHSAQSMSSNASGTKQGMQNQLIETDLVATAVTQMGSTIEEIASNTESAAQMAETTSANALSGRQGVEQTVARIDNLATRLTESSDAVNLLAEESETIGKVLDVIKGIAEQTNLLALNAAIEAARAGEQGRGFAVVADEVRNLAMRTQESTQEIGGIIESLQSRTQGIVSLIKDCHTQGQESTEQAKKAGELLNQITLDVGAISDMSTQIAAAIEEQSHVANEVNRNIVSIRDISELSDKSAGDNVEASDQVLAQATALHRSVQKFVA